MLVHQRVKSQQNYPNSVQHLHTLAIFILLVLPIRSIQCLFFKNLSLKSSFQSSFQIFSVKTKVLSNSVQLCSLCCSCAKSFRLSRSSSPLSLRNSEASPVETAMGSDGFWSVPAILHPLDLKCPYCEYKGNIWEYDKSDDYKWWPMFWHVLGSC